MAARARGDTGTSSGRGDVDGGATDGDTREDTRRFGGASLKSSTGSDSEPRRGLLALADDLDERLSKPRAAGAPLHGSSAICGGYPCDPHALHEGAEDCRSCKGRGEPTGDSG